MKKRQIYEPFGDVDYWIKWENTGWLFLGHLNVNFIHLDLKCDAFHASMLFQPNDVVRRISSSPTPLKMWIFGTSNAQWLFMRRIITRPAGFQLRIINHRFSTGF